MRPLVFLVDVDNTLLDNDGVAADLKRHLDREVGPKRRRRYWAIFEQLRRRLGYADYLGALQRYRVEHPHDSHLLTVSEYLLDYPFERRLFSGALEVLARLRRRGPVVILTDGDVVFQPRKIERSGLQRAAGERALIYIHKERELADIRRRYPARRYTLIDDKLRILAAFKKKWGRRVTTVFPRQGHYARDPKLVAAYPPADVTIERIADILSLDIGASLTNVTPPH